MAGMGTGTPASVKVAACDRCRARKTKCDGILPVCTPCQKAKVVCKSEERRVGAPVSRSYLWELEQRLKRVEERLFGSSQSAVTRSPSSLQDSHGQTPARIGHSDEDSLTSHHRPDAKRRRSSYDVSSPMPVSTSGSHTHVQAHAYESDGEANDVEEEDGKLKDFQIALDHDPLSRLARTALEGAPPDYGKPVRHLKGPHHHRLLMGDLQQTQDPREAPARFIGEELAGIALLRKAMSEEIRKLSPLDWTTPSKYDAVLLRRLVHRYFRYVNCPFAALHQEMFAAQMDRVVQGSGSTHDHFQVLMVLASSVASLCRSDYQRSELGRVAVALREASDRFAGSCSKQGWRALQDVILTIQYSLMVPSSGGTWRLCGEAMRMAVELNLQCEPIEPNNPLLEDILRRLFWTTYCLDRMISCALGRPCTLPDQWIETRLPAVVEDRYVAAKGIGEGPICHLKVTNNLHIRLRRIQSEVHQQLYTPADNIREAKVGFVDSDLDRWTSSVQTQLVEWHRSFVLPTPFITSHWIDLQYHLTLTMLLRPSPRRPKPSIQTLSGALESSGECLQIYYRLYREIAINFGSIALRNLFMAGLTFLHALQELSAHGSPIRLSLADIAQRLQASNIVLDRVTSSETTTEAERIRIAFEKLSQTVLTGILENPHRFPTPSQAQSLQKSSEIPSALDRTPWSSLRRAFANEQDMDHFFAHDVDNCPAPPASLEVDSALYDVGPSTNEFARFTEVETPAMAANHFMSYASDDISRAQSLLAGYTSSSDAAGMVHDLPWDFNYPQAFAADGSVNLHQFFTEPFFLYPDPTLTSTTATNGGSS